MSESDASDSSRPTRIAIVGPCSSGKSILGRALAPLGVEVRQPAQEHSYVPAMWQRITRPDLLIYLDVDYEHVQKRRPRNNGGPQRLREQHERLVHARRHCDFYLDTSGLAPAEVKAAVFTFLKDRGVVTCFEEVAAASGTAE